MRLWLNFKDLFSFQPPSLSSPEPLLSEIYRELMFEGSSSDEKAQLDNIRFDNTMRIGISLLALFVSCVLWMGRMIPSLGSVVFAFVCFAVAQISLAIFLTRSPHFRAINFSLCSVDLLILSW